MSQTPMCMAALLSVSRLVRAMISAIASSTTLRVFEKGALNTATPRRVADTRSIWLVPMQNAPTASRQGAASSAPSVSCVRDLMPRMSTPVRRSHSSASPRARLACSTSNPAASSTDAASGWMFSSSRARRRPFACLPCSSIRVTAPRVVPAAQSPSAWGSAPTASTRPPEVSRTARRVARRPQRIRDRARPGPCPKGHCSPWPEAAVGGTHPPAGLGIHSRLDARRYRSHRGPATTSLPGWPHPARTASLIDSRHIIRNFTRAAQSHRLQPNA